MRKLLLGLILSMLAVAAMAGDWLVEPYLGYSFISGDVHGVDVEGNGVQYGARLGYNFPLLSTGLQYDRNSITDLKFSDYESYGKGEGTGSNLGVFALAALPLVGLRAWGTYFFMAGIDGTKSGGPLSDDTKIRGHAFGLGVGYKLPVLPLAFNLEYRQATYDKKDIAPGTAEIYAFTGTVSCPLDF